MVDELRICSTCQLEKNYPSEFKSKNSNLCKKCRNLKLKAERALKPKKSKQSKEEKLKKIYEWQKKNPDKRKDTIQKYHETHKEQEKEYYSKNKDKVIRRAKEYVIKNRDRVNQQARVRRKDPIIKLRNQISTLVRLNIKGKKCGSILKFLPYTIQELKSHIEKQFESWMTWENHGKYSVAIWDDNNEKTWTWQLDHIIPQKDLPYSNMNDENFKRCWSLDNLRPLSSKQNIINGTKLIRGRNVKY